MAETLPGPSRFRSLRGPLSLLTRALLISIPLMGVFFILEIPSYLGWAILMEQYYGLFLGLVLCCIFLVVPPTKKSSRDALPWYDAIFAIIGLCIGLYVFVLYPKILGTMGVITPGRVVMGTSGIILILESLRRLTGWVLPLTGLLFILYARFTWLVPGVFNGPGMSWDKLANYLFLDTNALFGTAMMVCAVIVLAFILFGNLLFGIGGGAFLSDFAMALFGRFRGGPAKMAVLASSLFGSLSGSAVANVATTGVVTIPLMKKSGYKPHIAGAIEAVASTGGTLTPPIMGAAAFIIAEFTGIPYSRVALASLIPAILYYACVFFQIDLEAGKADLRGLPKDRLPRIGGILKHSYLFIIPLGTLVYTLFIMMLSPGKAALISVLSILVIGLVRRETRFRVTWLFDSLEKSGRNLLELTAIVAMAGLIIGIIQSSGLGFIFPLILGQAAGTNAFLLLVIVALACIVLGMGMPTVAVYLLLGVLMGPVLVQVGFPKLASHLFIQYFGTLSMFTPPICLAAYAAASIADAPSIRTAFAAMRIGILAYPVPFLFVFSPAFLLEGPPGIILWALISALAGAFFIGCGLVGYFTRNLGWAVRIGMGTAGLGLLIPASGQLFTLGLVGDVLGFFIGLLLLLREWRWGKRTREKIIENSLAFQG